MKEEGSAITLGDGGKKDKITKKMKISAYFAIGALLLFVLWANISDVNPSFDIQKVASITSWSVGATTTDSFGFFRRQKLPDLSAEILSKGIRDKEGIYRENDTLTTESVGAIRIKVSNVGKIESSEYKFKITLPTKEYFTYISPSQRALTQDEEKIFIFTFDKLVATSSAYINLEIETMGSEESVVNNIATTEIEVF